MMMMMKGSEHFYNLIFFFRKEGQSLDMGLDNKVRVRALYQPQYLHCI